MADRRRLLLLGAAGLAGVVLLWLALEHVGSLPGDARALQAVRDAPLTGRSQQVVTFFGDLGDDAVAALVTLVAAAVVAFRLGPRAALLVLVAAGAGLLAQWLKDLLGPTPDGRRTFGLASYPSGHVAWAAGLGGALAVLGHWHRRPEVVLVALGVALAMGPARVLAASHLPSDALAGYLLGAGWLALLLAALDPRTLRR